MSRAPRQLDVDLQIGPARRQRAGRPGRSKWMWERSAAAAASRPSAAAGPPARLVGPQLDQGCARSAQAAMQPGRRQPANVDRRASSPAPLTSGHPPAPALADQRDRVEVVVQEVLAVDALTPASRVRAAARRPARRCPSTQPSGRVDQRRASAPIRPAALSALAQLAFVGADQDAGHHRERQIGRVLGLAGPRQPLATGRRSRHASKRACCTRRRSGGQPAAARTAATADDQRRVGPLHRLGLGVELVQPVVLARE